MGNWLSMGQIFFMAWGVFNNHFLKIRKFVGHRNNFTMAKLVPARCVTSLVAWLLLGAEDERSIFVTLAAENGNFAKFSKLIM